MVLRGCLAILLFNVGQAFGAERIWALRGHVVDQEGRPVAGVSVATVWNANGVSLEQLRTAQRDGKAHPELTMNEGRLEPWGDAPAQTDAKGDFSIQLRSSNECKLMVVDKERKRGALILVDPRNPPSRVECKLVPLIRLSGRVRVSATGEPTRDVTVLADLPVNEDFPLGRYRLALCSSVKSRFEFWLPPGDYRLEAFGHDPPDLELTKSHPIRLTASQREFDCGVLDLSPTLYLWRRIEEGKKSGTWRDLTKRYGQPCPQWHVVDSRGIRKDAQPSDFRGKWVLVYFWSPGCGPCLEKTLPNLREFYETHKTRRDRFELVSICSVDAKLQTMADLDRGLKPIVKTVWGGKELPFPVLLDNTSKTMESFGVESFGAMVLIDPTGRLFQGDESTLKAILEDGGRTRSGTGSPH